MTEEVKTTDNLNKNICSKCSKEVPEAEKKMYEGDDGKTPICICDECANKIKEEYEMATKDVNIFKCLLFGITASFITGLIWYWIAVATHTMYDIVVIGLGFIIAIACSMGAGNKKGWKVQLIAILLTLLTIIYAEGIFAHNAVSPEPVFSGGILKSIAELIVLPLFAITSLGFIGSLFSMIALYVAFAVTKKEELKLIK
ncbi:hypothetical protein IJD34_05115 [bacterium]|nr:hypothetical protein [bacterium]